MRPAAAAHLFGVWRQRARLCEGKGGERMGIFTQSIEVDCTPAGVPIRLRWQGREYKLAAEPVRWFERRKWWTEEVRAERGRGPGLVDYEVWQLQVKLAGVGPLRTFEVSRQVETGRWRIIRMPEAYRESA